MRVQRPPRVLSDSWYAGVGEGFTPLTALLERWPRRLMLLVLRTGPLRAAVMLLAATRFDAIAVVRHDPGWRSLLLGRAIFGTSRKLVVLQLIDHPPRASLPGRLIDLAWGRLEAWGLRRALAGAQVLSDAERTAYASRFGLPVERLRLIPFAWRISPPGSAGPVRAAGSTPDPRAVVAAGRAYCDWETLFAAAAGSGWALTVVCGAQDLQRLRELNRTGVARIECDLPRAEVARLLQRAAVSVICLQEGEQSRGHVRLCDAVEAGAAVVATRVACLHGYVEDGRTAVLVPPRDPAALRAAVDGLLGDEQRRARIAAAAFELAEAWTGRHYLQAVVAFAREVSPRPGRALPASASGIEKPRQGGAFP
jgi:hypothetical protein